MLQGLGGMGGGGMGAGGMNPMSPWMAMAGAIMGHLKGMKEEDSSRRKQQVLNPEIIARSTWLSPYLVKQVALDDQMKDTDYYGKIMGGAGLGYETGQSFGNAFGVGGGA